ncbi:F-box protein cpr30 [Phtheirospermum japonicum]|uniref:F-box protein cpr30 n=1 Tax=Phtheirospermum japonicum TaxID=374723 RepID=A0A830DDC2_9LAMI|nr:F-box protein cpr30 [Phtheirospermum japonicum]
MNELPDKSLPLELIENILSRLPVKSLKRFRAVEKSWCHLIDSEKFAKTHLQRSLTSNSNGNLITLSKYGFFWMGLESLDNAQSIEPEFECANLDCHALSNSCNGMVVIVRDSEPHVLWNPFSREHKVLPKCPCDFPNNPSLSCKISFGFGYDSKNDDYKVVKVMLYEKPSSFMLSEEWIYSLKSDCWRRTKGTYYGRGYWPAHVNGSLHTIIRTGPVGMERKKIMGFSLVSEKDYEVAMPEEIDEKGLKYPMLDVFDGCLALVCNYGSFVHIWVMEEYGVKESWTPWLSFEVEADEVVRPLAYTKDRDKVVLYCGSKALALCGLRPTSVQKLILPFVFWPGVIVETLISPNGWAGEKSSTEKQNNKKEHACRDDFLSAGFKLVL